MTPLISTATIIAALDRLGYSFSVNDCDDTLEVNSERMDDYTLAEIYSRMHDEGYDNRAVIYNAMMTVAKRHRHHPVKDYLRNLPLDLPQQPQDQMPIARLANYFQDDHGIFYKWLRRMLLNSVAKVMQRAQSPMWVMDGKQKIGKSFFVRWLVPEELHEKGFYLEKSLTTAEKDDRIRLMRTWIWEVPELQSTIRKADREALKHLITQEWVTERAPYGHFDTMKPAITTFIGTLNDEGGFLTDPTGNRRFNICRITDIDQSYTKHVTPDEIWAEAYAAYIDGEPCQPTPDEEAIRDAINQDYEVPDIIAEKIIKYFRLEPGNMNLFTPSIEILEQLEANGLTGNQRANAMHLSTALIRLGCKRGRGIKNGKRLNGYYGIEVKSPMGP